MEPAPVPSPASYCNDNQQKSGPDTESSGSPAIGAYIHSWAVLCHGLKGRRPSMSSLSGNQER